VIGLSGVLSHSLVTFELQALQMYTAEPNPTARMF